MRTRYKLTILSYTAWRVRYVSITNVDIANSTITAGKKNIWRDNVKLFLDVKKKSAISGTPKCAKIF